MPKTFAGTRSNRRGGSASSRSAAARAIREVRAGKSNSSPGDIRRKGIHMATFTKAVNSQPGRPAKVKAARKENKQLAAAKAAKKAQRAAGRAKGGLRKIG